MTKLELAVRCLQIETEIADRDGEILALHARVIERDDDDDSARFARIEALRAEIETLRSEQASCTKRMAGPVDLAEAAAALAANL